MKLNGLTPVRQLTTPQMKKADAPKINTTSQNQPSISLPKSLPSSNLMQVYFAGTKSIWSQADAEKRTNIMAFADDYKGFLNAAKTDITAVKEIVKSAEANGFKAWPDKMPEGGLKPGDKFYRNNRDRSISMIVVGKDPMETGFKLAGAHIDSPHIMLKPKPVQDAPGGFSIFKTMVHGGIKEHQWTQRNLALVGLVAKPGGEVIEVNIGNKPGEPVLFIPELPIHTDRDKSKSLKDAFPKESLNPIVANTEPDCLDDKTEKTVSDQVLAILKEQYNIDEEDLVHAQLALVPATEARDAGLDSSMISGYGSDDKSSAYCVKEALFDVAKQAEPPQKTVIGTFFSNEEIGSWNNYGAQSDETRAIVSDLIEYTHPDQPYNENITRKAFKNSVLVSADVSTAVDPIRPDAEESSSAAKMGHGPALYKNGALFSLPEASRKFADTQNGLQLQAFAFNQDKGGGGTIGNFLATNHNTDVVDTGIPVIGMHAPIEVVNKSDLYEHYLSMKDYFLN